MTRHKTIKRRKRKSMGEVVREAREDMGMAYRQAASEIGICRSTMFDIEHDKAIPRLDTAVNICETLMISFDEMIDGLAETLRRRGEKL